MRYVLTCFLSTITNVAIFIVMFCDMVACDGLGIDEIITNVANM